MGAKSSKTRRSTARALDVDVDEDARARDDASAPPFASSARMGASNAAVNRLIELGTTDKVCNRRPVEGDDGTTGGRTRQSDDNRCDVSQKSLFASRRRGIARSRRVVERDYDLDIF